ncbi:DUF4190 domain-containing protein [Nocardioides pelophilus]|uniref:DUF4190 domain-containing protein n=1 Tax=Nocardioides pelophilus TaxID=2172019 RepID=UPI001603A151|nr:DUF4190 domain-containing protein [Nocardioides pelophilus]
MSYEPPNYGSPPPPPPGGGGGYGAPPPPGGGYGAPQPGFGGAAQPSQSVMALISLIAGIIGILSCCCFIPSAAALILGILGKKEIAESGGLKTGGGMAQAGFILGIAGLALGVLYWIFSIIWNVSVYNY